MKKVDSFAGYTLIEILVSLTILTILFTVGFAGYRDFSRRQALQGVVKILQGDLRKAQQNAMSGIKPDVSYCNDPQTLEGYYFNITSSTTYKISAYCSGGTLDVDERSLTSGITFTTYPTPNPILFKVLGQGTNLTTGTSIILTQAGTGNTATISLGVGGDIK